ncbi:uncharacterized protein [Diabrotica undecimpunctata]|uniref:uncharacterized protein n=1 Tax=Diabrotica undecimpunctata TaxID=50387 RepID=UPI003B63FD83
MIYGSKTWTVTSANEERLRVWERKILRKIFGPVLDGAAEQYRIRPNNELEELYLDANIIKEVKSRTLRWAGHLRRHSDERIVRLKEVLTERRPRGRPRLQFTDNIAEDLKAMGVENWMKLTQERDE